MTRRDHVVDGAFQPNPVPDMRHGDVVDLPIRDVDQ